MEQTKHTTQKLFTELFRPKDLKSMILPPRIINELSKGICQNLLLYGPAGCGKTSLSKILYTNYPTLELNGSMERGIDIMRDKVVNFAATISLENGSDKLKIVFIDEADGITPEGWDSLRNTIEKYASSVRFICTCNHIDKIPEPIQSRFNCIPVYPINKTEEKNIFALYCEYIGVILNKLNIKYENDILNEFVKSNFPDMRSILNNIQKIYLQQSGVLDKESILHTFECHELFNRIFISNDPVENYKFIMSEYSTCPDDVILSFSKDFINFLRVNYPDKISKIPLCIITIAEHCAQINQVMDKVITLLSLVYKLQIIINLKQ